jgi:diguanylate cyclase (GGDEF)-like protein
MQDGSSAPEIHTPQPATPTETAPTASSSMSHSRLAYWRNRISSIMNSHDATTKRFGGNPDNDPPRLKRHRAFEQARMEQKVTINRMTGLMNREPFLEAEEREIGTIDRDPHALGFTELLIDADNFGQVNKKHGNPVGDRVLGTIGEAIRSSVRETDIAARLGGEEFKIIATKTTTENRTPAPDSVSLEEKVRRGIESSTSPDGIKITASIGKTDYIRGEGKEAFDKRINEALIVAKRRGKNRVAEGNVVNGVNVYTDLNDNTRWTVTYNEKGEVDQLVPYNG